MRNMQGRGVQTIEMNFLPDVYVTCKDCDGLRYNRETLEVKYKGKSISDIQHDHKSGCGIFWRIPHILQKVKPCRRLIRLSLTGSHQPPCRVVKANALNYPLNCQTRFGQNLYILDEPTTGLHFEDVRVLLDAQPPG